MDFDKIPEFILPYELEPLEYYPPTSLAAGTHGIRLEITEKTYSEEVFTAEYTYVQERVRKALTVRGLAELMNATATGYRPEEGWEMCFYEGDTLLGRRRFSYLPCERATREAGLAFVTGRFLSVLDGDKWTTGDARERLNVYAYGTGKITIVETALYLAEGGLETARTERAWDQADEDPDKYGLGYTVQADVSPRRYERAGRQLLEYTVTCGGRRQRYRLLPEEYRARVTFDFLNAFHVRETFTCPGVVERDPQYGRQTATVNGETVNYEVVETAQFKCTTGILKGGMGGLLEDLLRSTDVRVNGVRVTITASEAKRTNAWDAMPTGTVTFRPASDRGMPEGWERLRVFDRTFDGTFD